FGHVVEVHDEGPVECSGRAVIERDDQDAFLGVEDRLTSDDHESVVQVHQRRSSGHQESSYFTTLTCSIRCTGTTRNSSSTSWTIITPSSKRTATSVLLM